MYEISKEFEFDYGHRVHNQVLNKQLSINTETKCRHLHGHRGKIIVYLESYDLYNSVVMDFNQLNWFKKFIDETLDHKFIIDINDPLLYTLLTKFTINNISPIKIDNVYFDEFNVFKPDFLSQLSDTEKEYYESFVFINTVPTAENICKLIYNIILMILNKNNYQSNEISVSKIEFFETPKSKAIFYPL